MPTASLDDELREGKNEGILGAEWNCKGAHLGNKGRNPVCACVYNTVGKFYMAVDDDLNVLLI